MPYIEGDDRNQVTLFPESIDDFISEENPVRVIDAYVELLDMVALGFKFASCPSVGRPPYNPKVFLSFIYTDTLTVSVHREDWSMRLPEIWKLYGY